jgi:hypothetical protein
MRRIVDKLHMPVSGQAIDNDLNILSGGIALSGDLRDRLGAVLAQRAQNYRCASRECVAIRILSMTQPPRQQPYFLK